jgi:hypothetical protein
MAQISTQKRTAEHEPEHEPERPTKARKIEGVAPVDAAAEAVARLKAENAGLKAQLAGMVYPKSCPNWECENKYLDDCGGHCRNCSRSVCPECSHMRYIQGDYEETHMCDRCYNSFET